MKKLFILIAVLSFNGCATGKYNSAFEPEIIAFLIASPTARQILRDLRFAPLEIKRTVNSTRTEFEASSAFKAERIVIYWNPNQHYVMADGTKVDARRALVHEIIHAWFLSYGLLGHEEAPIIEKENEIMRELGDVYQRKSHYGRPFYVDPSQKAAI